MTRDCDTCRPLLDDLVDGLLDPRDQRRARRHAASCESCGATLRGLEALLDEVDGLPSAVEPPRDLWPAITSRLAEGSERRRSVAGLGWALRAAAALAFMALGAILSQLSTPTHPTPEAGPRLAGEPPAAPLAGERRADFALAEADYLRAKEVLWAVADTYPESLEPEAREVVERNLRIIDQAIRELRAALHDDPGNARLENLLLAQHRTEIDLLQRLALGTSEI